MIADTTGGVEARLLARSAAILVIATATAFLAREMLVPGDPAAGYLVDERTGEIWACAPGGCQVND